MCVKARRPSWLSIHNTIADGVVLADALFGTVYFFVESHQEPSSYMPRRAVGISNAYLLELRSIIPPNISASCFSYAPDTGQWRRHRTQNMVRKLPTQSHSTYLLDKVRGAAPSHALWATTTLPRRDDTRTFRDQLGTHSGPTYSEFCYLNTRLRDSTEPPFGTIFPPTDNQISTPVALVHVIVVSDYAIGGPCSQHSSHLFPLSRRDP